MNSLSRHLRASSVSSSLRGYGGIKWATRFSAQSNGGSGWKWNLEQQVPFPRASGVSPGSANTGGNNFSAPNAPSFQSFLRSAPLRDNSMWGNSKSMDFVRGIIEEEGRNTAMGTHALYRPNIETNADIVHIKMLRNNTFVTVTDSKGKVKCKASSGCLPELKGGPKLSRYAAEATAEHVGRIAKTMGLRSVVVKVNGFIHFKKKRQAIEAFREGFTNSRSDQNPIVYIEDTTRKAHNGCRLPRKRRV